MYQYIFVISLSCGGRVTALEQGSIDPATFLVSTFLALRAALRVALRAFVCAADVNMGARLYPSPFRVLLELHPLDAWGHGWDVLMGCG